MWHGTFVETRLGKKAWMSTATAAQPRQHGGLSVPDLATEFKRLSFTTVQRWSQGAAGIRSEVGQVLLHGPGTDSWSPRPCRRPPQAPLHDGSLAKTGQRTADNVHSQERTPEERERTLEILPKLKTQDRLTRSWEDEWYVCDYSKHSGDLRALRAYQEVTHGTFDLHALLSAKLIGDDILILHDGSLASHATFRTIAKSGDTLADVLEIQPCAPDRVRFRSRRCPFPLSRAQVDQFRLLCDVITANYPVILALNDDNDMLRTVPPTTDVWRLRRSADAITLLWEPTPNTQVQMGLVTSTSSAAALIRKALDNPSIQVLSHPWLGIARCIWRHPQMTRSCRVRQYLEAPAAARADRENQARDQTLRREDCGISAALASISWKSIDRLPASTSRQRLLLRRVKGGRLSGWDRLHKRRGCPHCAAEDDGGSIGHIFWSCPMAQDLWQQLWAVWGLSADFLRDHDRLKQAAFGLRAPDFPGMLWYRQALATTPRCDATKIIQMHEIAACA